MAETVPTPVTLAYAQGQLADCLAKMEDARVASNISGQGNTWTPQAMSSLQSQADYWAAIVQKLTSKAAGARNTAAAVAVWQ